MKKILAILSAAVFALSLSTGVFAAENIALKATVEVDSVNQQYGGEGKNLNDGNSSTRWQSNAKMTEADPCWAALIWEDNYEINDITIYWENARPAEDGYVIEISTDGGKTWKDSGFKLEKRTNDVKVPKPDGSGEDTEHVDVLTIDAPVTANALRVYCTKGQPYGEGEIKDIASIFELEVYGTKAADAPAADDKEDDKTDAPAADDKEDDKTETSKPDTSKPADKPSTNPDTGVESVAIWAVLFAAAAAVVLTVKKVRA